jgi:hypothetical protein
MTKYFIGPGRDDHIGEVGDVNSALGVLCGNECSNSCGGRSSFEIVAAASCRELLVIPPGGEAENLVNDISGCTANGSINSTRSDDREPSPLLLVGTALALLVLSVFRRRRKASDG